MAETNDFASNNHHKYAHVVEEEEDNDGHGKHGDKEPSSTNINAAIQIANTIMGAGILNLPLVMRCLGLPLGITFIVLTALVTIYSVHVLLECSEQTGKKGYSMFAKIIFGAKGSLVVKIVIIINNFGLCCAYFNIFGSTCKSLVKALVSNDPDNFFVSNYNNFFYILIIFFLMSFLIFKESIDSLKKASFLGVVGITIFFFTFIFIFIYKCINGLIPEITSEYLKPNGEITHIFASLPSVFLAFTFQFNVFPVYMSLRSKCKKDMLKSTVMGVGFCLIIYLITGIIGLLMYGLPINGSVLVLLDKDIEQFKDSDTVILVCVIIINIAFLISSTMSIPLMFFSLKKNFVNSVIFCKKKFIAKKAKRKEQALIKKNMNNNKENDYKYATSDNDYDYEDDVDYINQKEKNGYTENLIKNTDDIIEKSSEKTGNNDINISTAPQTNKKTIDKKTKVIIIISLYCLITGCTILVPGLDTIFGIVGSTAANSISFILPNTFGIYLRPGKNILSRFLSVIGIVVLIVCLASEILKSFNNKNVIENLRFY